MQILQSDVVRVRRARWQVARVQAFERCQLLTLTGVDTTNVRTKRHILTPFDIVERIERRARPVRVSMRSWRRACRALIAAETPPGGLRCARSAHIELLPHQLEPALALIRGLGSRVLLADAVGLGKTIQAGLIVSELRALGAADRTLILTPAGLRDQWARELVERFDLDATIFDARGIRHAVAALPVGVNPWRTAPIAVASIDYVKRPDVLASAAACRADILIVDEAHGVAGESDRHAAVAALAAHARWVVLLTATPHSGDRLAFGSLCGLGALTGTAKGDPLLVFQRTREDVKLGTARRIHRLFVRPSAAEARMYALLARFSTVVQHEHGVENPGNLGNPANLANPENHGLWLALSVLHKRALSSAWSLQRSVERRLAALAPAGANDGDQLDLPFADSTGECLDADEPPAWSPALCLRDPSLERRLLNDLATAAAAAVPGETKRRALCRLLRRVNEPAVVFTEYRDTLVHLRESFEGRVSLLHGGLTRAERLEAVDDFTRGRSLILLATDAAGEGLNLHHTCRTVVNVELPWNPMRLEQRIGRVDRLGQTRTVHVFHLMARDSQELEILVRLERRLARARTDIDVPDPLGMEGDTAGEPDAAEAVEKEDLVTPALGAVARTEVERIARARAFVRAGDEDLLARLEARGPCLARAGRAKTRMALGRCLLLLCRTGMDAGVATARRPAGSVLLPLLIRPAGRNWNARNVLEHLDADIRRHIERATAAWRQQCTEIHQSFIGARLSRERTIGAADVSGLPIFQPGLFDRRIEHARLAVVAAATEHSLDKAAAVAVLEQATALSPTDAELVLVLAP